MHISPDRAVSDAGEPGAVPEPNSFYTRGMHPLAEQKAQAVQDAQQEPRRSPRAVLIQIIEGEIIPRLFLAHRVTEPVSAETCGEFSDCMFMAELFLHNDCAAVVKRLQTLVDLGISYEHVYLELLAPVPQTLSQFWAEGRCSFDEMAVGLCCVDDVLRRLHEREHAGPQSF